MLPQAIAALEKANVIRNRRAQVKRAIASGQVRVSDLIKYPAPELGTMPVVDLLRAQDHWGPVKSRRFLARFHIGESRQLGRLSDRQRRELAQALAARRNGK